MDSPPGERGPAGRDGALRPAVLGKYRLIAEIGRGASGVVHLAEDGLSGRHVALKLFEPASDAERELYERMFFNEVRASGMLRHPNIVRVLDAGRQGARFFVVMDYVDGARTLEAYRAPPQRLTAVRVLEVGLDCAEALHYAHGKGVVHRDVKPANVLLDARGRAQLTDFGIAMLGEGALAETSPVAAAGSPLYMAPEQIGRDAATPRSDVFALGVVLYELLAGRHPFEAATLPALVRRVLEDEPEPLERLRPDLPPAIGRVLARATAKHAPDRHASALELAADLAGIIGEPRRPLEGLTAESRAHRLRRLDFFRDFDEPEIWELLRWARWEEFAADDVLVREGEHGDSFFIVVDGELDVRKSGLSLARLAAGACFGEIAYLSRRLRSASVVAVSPVSVLRVNAALLEYASDRCQLAFQRVFIRTLIERLVDTTELLAGGAG